jgi:hypothetical protein
MTELIAKTVIKNKFWIVEDQGTKVATIQAVEDGGFVYVHDDERERFATIKLLSKTYNVAFDKTAPKKEKVAVESHDVHGFPVSHKPWNVLWDVKHQFPVYTKTSKSKSYYCAGYYVIKFNNGWVKSYCPKFITLNRYEFKGPFKTKAEMQEQLRLANGK